MTRASSALPASPEARVFGPGLVLVLVMLTALTPLTTDMYLAAFPQMAVEFSASASMVQLTLTALMVGAGVGQLVIGPLSDSVGRRRLLLVCIAICLVAGVICALAPSVQVLIVARLVQGLTGGAGMVLGRAVIADRTSGPATMRLMNALIAAGAISAAVAPALGGQIIQWSGWRAVFWVLSGIVGAMLLASAFAVPESLTPEKRRSTGFVEFSRGIGELLRNPRFVAYLVAGIGGSGAFFAYLAGSPFVIQDYLGFGVRGFSIIFTLNAVGLVLVAMASMRLAGRVHAHTLVRIGLGIVITGSAALLLLTYAGVPTMPVLVILFAIVASQGLIMGNTMGLAVDQGLHRAGSGSALAGALPFAFAAVVMPIAGLGYQPRTLAIVMLVCSLVALVPVLWAPVAAEQEALGA